MKDYTIYLWSTVFLSSMLVWGLFPLVGTGAFAIPVIALLILISNQLIRLEDRRNQK
ncbi:hypothetical protein LC065_06030 [Halobacillus litoralis]|uniref:hypothetical protein n=1 Tax=Halobacillus litoralis TaxID=45668 RepID=UPI001CFCB409|nr:hypothetical protein [Halobacillus litoralis]WLR48739.1 hypothetical protein LC065_06030 [Halobacillus litoralis]